MANLPRNAYSLNGGLAFAGAPAYGNTNAQELAEGSTAGQIRQSLQQAASQERVREETRRVAANAMAQRFKSELQQATVQADPNALRNLRTIAAQPDLVQNLGMA